MRYDVIILGGGAAGLMCAIEAGKRGRRALVLERNERVGRKIEISGGGRCNFTNLYAEPDRYLSDNPRFCRSALARYTANDFIALIESHNIGYHEKKLGQLFCDERSRGVIRMLENECAQAGVEIRAGHDALDVEKNEFFRVHAVDNVIEAQSVVVACGGLSIPKVGASDMGYRIARRFHLDMIEPRPGLVPLLWTPEDCARWGDLRGTAFETEAHCGKATFAESALFTHRGLSGPAILQISSYWREGQAIRLNLLPGLDPEAWLMSHRGDSALLSSLLSERLPRRLAKRWCELNEIDAPLKQLGEKTLRRAAERLRDWRIVPAGCEGYRKAEVTLGGVDTRALSPKTMEAKRVPGLYFIGEVVDVTGWLGGYNFQWAWSSGWCAGQYA